MLDNFEQALIEHERQMTDPYKEELTPEQLQEIDDDIGNQMFEEFRERQMESYLWNY